MDHNAVCNPEHYLKRGISPQRLIEAWDLPFAEGNVIKYVTRAQHKGKPVEDLEKAVWYALRAYEKACARAEDRPLIEIDDKDDPDNPFGQAFLREFKAFQAKQ
jgi:hypothetical protein